MWYPIVAKLGIETQPLGFPLSVISPLGKSTLIDEICRQCMVRVGEHELRADLIVLDLDGLNVLLGMDWLSAYHAILDCFAKRVIFRPPGTPEFVFQGEKPKKTFSMVLQKMDLSLMAHKDSIFRVEQRTKLPEIVEEFPDIFPDNLPRLPPIREMEFRIDLLLGPPRYLSHLIEWCQWS